MTLWIEEPELKISERRQKGGLKRKDKSPKAQKGKSAKWHGNEEQTNISAYHMLQSCGV